MKDYTQKMNNEDFEEVTVEADETQDMSEMHERHRKSKGSTAVVISACVFLVVLVATIIVVAMTIKNNKQRAADDAAKQAFQQSEQQTPTQSPESDPAIEDQSIPTQNIDESVDPSIVPGADVVTFNGSTAANAAFPTRDLNNNSLPNYNYNAEEYAHYLGMIDAVNYGYGLTDADAQAVLEAFTCYIEMIGWEEPGHVLTVTTQEDENWYLVMDSLTESYFHVSPTYNTCYMYMWDLEPEVLYNIDSVVCNNYGSLQTSYSLNEPNEGVATIDAHDYNEQLMIDLSTYEIIEITNIP